MSRRAEAPAPPKTRPDLEKELKPAYGIKEAAGVQFERNYIREMTREGR